MQPTTLEGEQLFVNKPACDPRVSGNRLIRRIVGIPGASVAMSDNALHINDENLSYFASDEFSGDRLAELPLKKYMVRVQIPGESLSSFALL